MFNTDFISILQFPSQRPAVNLEFLLDTLDATEELWRELPAPCSLFMEEIRQALSLAVGVGHGN
jgi:hypothetical protein